MTTLNSIDSTTDSASSAAPAPADPAPLPSATVTRIGFALAISAPLWAVVMALFGRHEGFGWQTIAMGVPALAFQLSVLGLLRIEAGDRAMSRPAATGRVARIGFGIEAVLVCGAMVSTILDAGWLLHGTPLWAAMDLCWPLSMLGMLIIGIRIAIAGRWTGALRWHALFAHSWILWGIPLSALGGPGMYLVVVQVILGYGWLGARLALRPHDGR